MVGKVRCVLINEATGEVRQDEEFNFLMPAIENYMAQVLAAEANPYNMYISVGTADMVEYTLSNINNFIQLGATYSAVAEQFTADATHNVREVLFAFKRIGNPGAGQMWVTIEGDAAGFPNNTPIATSGMVVMAGVGTAAQEWVKFPITPSVNLGAGLRHVVLHMSGFTHSVGVNEMQMGLDTTGVTPYVLGVDELGNGASWGTYTPFPSGDVAFRIVRETDVDVDTTPTNIIDTAPITTLDSLSNETRILAIFGTGDANDFLRELYLLPSIGAANHLAVSTISVDKTSQDVLMAYWLLSFRIDPDNP